MIEITTRPSLKAIAAIANVPESYVEDPTTFVVVEKWESWVS